jgi:hypothetical protein
MYETTLVPYGDGVITITMSSESATEVAAPNIRFGSYNDAVEACFTGKELESRASGEDAVIGIHFLMSDEIINTDELSFFDAAIEEQSKEIGALHKGVFFDVDATKTVGGEEVQELGAFFKDVEMQYDVPLYLTSPDRVYFVMTNEMGVCSLFSDTDIDADTLTVKAGSIGTSLLLYQDKKESLVPHYDGFRITTKHLMVGGIIVLAVLWIVVERLHKKNRV